MVLSKWRGRTDRSIAAEKVERLVADIEDLTALVTKLATQDEEIEKLKADLAEAREEVKSIEDDRDGYAEQLERTLTDVKYWMIGPLVHHLPMRDPRVILRRIEDVLG